MNLNKVQIAAMDRIRRIKILNGISGIKPVNLIGTVSASGNTNLAVFSSVVHLGSDPALLGFIMRPVGEVPRHTYENILETGSYTINHVHPEFVENAHYTSAKFEGKESEFEQCGLHEEYHEDISAPFVTESRVKLGMNFIEDSFIKHNGTRLIIGEINRLILPDEAVDSNDELDYEILGTVGTSGLNGYYGVNKIGRYPYARIGQIPDTLKS
ncbi:flavin reductase family protein [Zeaxanthinibacter enoshimensis]|uniref:Flavin reductase like protein n=1 Tax=Zeaxanthinibacter enoshimensis TaxID=392009 RepID=A0A4R6TJT8_9FLAO|nr:flavin reductase [Zeaxanthinibacter enoshimensis]TDQ31116.1 flavin reductase like protein [Zeaxanthinibacter enoshimensis]